MGEKIQKMTAIVLKSEWDNVIKWIPITGRQYFIVNSVHWKSFSTGDRKYICGIDTYDEENPGEGSVAFYPDPFKDSLWED